MTSSDDTKPDAPQRDPQPTKKPRTAPDAFLDQPKTSRTEKPPVFSLPTLLSPTLPAAAEEELAKALEEDDGL